MASLRALRGKHEVYDVVYAAIHGRYLDQVTLPTVPGWDHLPEPFRQRLQEAIDSGGTRNDLLTVVGIVRREQLGKRIVRGYSARSEAFVSLLVGFLELSRQAGLTSDDDALKRVLRTTLSYVCLIDPQPFHALREECAGGEACGERITELFRPHAVQASEAVAKWGLALPDVRC